MRLRRGFTFGRHSAQHSPTLAAASQLFPQRKCAEKNAAFGSHGRVDERGAASRKNKKEESPPERKGPRSSARPHPLVYTSAAVSVRTEEDHGSEGCLGAEGEEA